MRYNGPLGLPRITGIGPLSYNQTRTIDEDTISSIVDRVGRQLDITEQTMEAAKELAGNIQPNTELTKASNNTIAAAAVLGTSGRDDILDSIAKVANARPDHVELAWLKMKSDIMGFGNIPDDAYIVYPKFGQGGKALPASKLQDVFFDEEDDIGFGNISESRIEYIMDIGLDPRNMPSPARVDTTASGNVVNAIVFGLDEQLEQRHFVNFRNGVESRFENEVNETTVGEVLLSGSRLATRGNT